MKRGAFIDGEYQDGELRGLVFVAGKRGEGKTTETARLLDRCGGRVLFFDSLSKHTLRGFAPVHQPGELKDALRGRRQKIIYQPRAGSLLDHFEAVCAIVYAVGWMIFAIDEVDMHTSAGQMPQGLYKLTNYGRHARVSMIFTARRPAQVARELTSQSHEMRLFRMTENRDVRYFAEFIGEDLAAKLRTLPKFHYLRWRDAGEPVIECAGRASAKNLLGTSER